METNIIKDTSNPLLHRREVLVDITFQGETPSMENVRNVVISSLGTNPELTIIKKIIQKTGMHKALVVVYVYNDEESLKRIEPLYILKRNNLIKENNKEEQS